MSEHDKILAERLERIECALQLLLRRMRAIEHRLERIERIERKLGFAKTTGISVTQTP